MGFDINALLYALGRGFTDLLNPRVWLLVILTFTASVFLWGGILFFYYGEVILSLKQLLSSMDNFKVLTDYSLWGWTGLDAILWLIILPSLYFLIWLTAALLVGVFAVPWIRRLLQNRYPQALGGGEAGAKPGASAFQSLRNLFSVLIVSALVFALLLFLFWVPGLWGGGVLLLGAWMNARLLFFEVCSEIHFRDNRAPQERWRSHRGSLILMGVFMGLIFAIPLVSMLVPMWSALSFFHLLCREAEQSTSTNRAG